VGRQGSGINWEVEINNSGQQSSFGRTYGEECGGGHRLSWCLLYVKGRAVKWLRRDAPDGDDGSSMRSFRS
jgi:hypothetical protein